MAALDLSKLVKEKKFWVASFLVAWAAALQVPIRSLFIPFPLLAPEIHPSRFDPRMVRLQGHMMWVQRQDAFKDKFGDPDAPNKVTEGEQQTPPSTSSSTFSDEQKVTTADSEFRWIAEDKIPLFLSFSWTDHQGIYMFV